jgi:hypothetical protein
MRSLPLMPARVGNIRFAARDATARRVVGGPFERRAKAMYDTVSFVYEKRYDGETCVVHLPHLLTFRVEKAPTQ